MTIHRILVVALAVFFECHSPQEVMSDELRRLSGMVNDFRSSLKVGYFKDFLWQRLKDDTEAPD
jgi:hypothetical protein